MKEDRPPHPPYHMKYIKSNEIYNNVYDGQQRVEIRFYKLVDLYRIVLKHNLIVHVFCLQIPL